MKLALAAGGAGSFRQPVLPWAVAAADERRFRRILRACLLAALALAVALPLIRVALPDRQTPQPLPAPITRLLLDRPATPPVPVKPPAKSEKAAADSSPPTPPQAEARPAPRRDALRPSARQPVPDQAPGEVALDQARRKAASSGLLALKNELSALTSAPPAVQLKADAQALPGVGTSSGPGAGAGSEAGEAVRALVTASAGRTSGGIGNLGVASRDSGGGGLPGRGTTLLQGSGNGGGGGGGSGLGASGNGGSGSNGRSVAGGSNPGGGEGAVAAAGKGAGASSRATRSIEDIKLVFERQKGAIYALYNRALRDDPSLQGKLVLELKIAPSGQVAGLRIVSSELKSEDLERKLLARIRSFDFGAKDVDTLVLTWPVDFLPS